MHLYKKKYKGYVKLYEALDKTIMNEATLNYIHKIGNKNEKVQRALLNLVNLTDEPYKASTGNPQWVKSINDRLFPNKNVELINLNMAKNKKFQIMVEKQQTILHQEHILSDLTPI